jgi:hypothetical protein
VLPNESHDSSIVLYGIVERHGMGSVHDRDRLTAGNALADGRIGGGETPRRAFALNDQCRNLAPARRASHVIVGWGAANKSGSFRALSNKP